MTSIPANLVTECAEWIRVRNYITFVELSSWLEARGIEPKGDFEISLIPNVVLWSGMSQAFCDVVEGVRPLTELHGSTVLVYLIDGGMLKMPIAKRPPKAGYKKPHWAPVTLCRKGSPL